MRIFVQFYTKVPLTPNFYLITVSSQKLLKNTSLFLIFKNEGVEQPSITRYRKMDPGFVIKDQNYPPFMEIGDGSGQHLNYNAFSLDLT